MRSVAEHRDAIGDPEDLFEMVRDENDPQPLGAKPIHRVEQRLDPVLIEHGRRLVENQDLGFDRNGLRDLDHLLLRDA